MEQLIANEALLVQWEGACLVHGITVSCAKYSEECHLAECLYLLSGMLCPEISISQELLPTLSFLTFLFLISGCPRFVAPL